MVAAAAAIAVIAVAFVLVQGGASRRATPSPESSSTPGNVAPATTRAPTFPPTERPSATPLDTSVAASGVVVPLRSADLAARVSGVVATVNVRDGSAVSLNQVVVKLDQSTYLAAIAVAEADLGRAHAAVEQAQSQLDQLPPDASPGQVETLQANVRLAEAERELAERRLAEAQTRLQQTEIRAPFPGTVADVLIAPGEQAVAGQTLLTVGDTSAWLIETTDLSELEVVRVAVGDRAVITFEALPETTLQGTVERIQVRGTSQDGGVVFAVAIRPDVNDPQLRWGMSATVRISPSG